MPCKKPKRSARKLSSPTKETRASESNTGVHDNFNEDEYLDALLISPDGSPIGRIDGETSLSEAELRLVHSVETLNKITAYIAEHEVWSPSTKWAWIRNTAILASSSPSRSACMDMLDGMVRAGKTSPLTAVEEVIAFDKKRLEAYNTCKGSDDSGEVSAPLSPETFEDLEILEELFGKLRTDDDFITDLMLRF